MPRRYTWRTWLVLAFGLGAIVAGIVALVVLSRSTLTLETRNRDQAFAEMNAVRARFGGRVPCLELSAQERVSSHRADERPRTVHMLAWEREDNRLIRVSTPYWVLQVGAFKIHTAQAIAPPLEHVTPADLDQCGRGLIVDRRTMGGGRLLMWTE